jgi:outer membrane protein assembly factor BamB
VGRSLPYKLYALDGATGQRLWEISGVRAPPAIGPDGTLYVGGWAGFLALDAATGLKRWEIPGEERTPWSWLTTVFGHSPAIAADGIVCVTALTSNCSFEEPLCSYPTHLRVLRAANGESVWDRGLHQEVVMAPSTSLSASCPTIGPDGTVYVGAEDGWVYAVRGSGGLAAGPWPKFRGDAQNTGRVRSESPLTLTISWEQEKVRLQWPPPALLQSTDALAPANWLDVIGAASPFDVQPANAQRF